MATDAQPAPTDAPTPRRRKGFESWSWLFMRVSGLALIFLALTHFAITHVLNDVVHTDYRFVADRWDNPWWRLFDWLLLALALLHGANGARWVVEDSVRRPELRTALKGAAYGLSAVLLAYGTFTIVTFSPR